eukprot:762585-Hanusia_phi.AAC.4
MCDYIIPVDGGVKFCKSSGKARGTYSSSLLDVHVMRRCRKSRAGRVELDLHDAMASAFMGIKHAKARVAEEAPDIMPMLPDESDFVCTFELQRQAMRCERCQLRL